MNEPNTTLAISNISALSPKRHQNKMQDAVYPVALRIEEAAKYINVSRRQLYSICEKDPTFPKKIYYSTGCAVFLRESLDNWLKEKERQAV
ncbi:helix-turn-helix transcriptional regulator [Oceanospirillum maris]|uniref:helix-turn-helix transcriptional regulator n=1 Tax=Oceanospirillum maris TaxID=64977 RepID=UPI0003FC1974|nr:AlpA family phage regulatory protein [Oceanospirillum maris]